MTKSDQPLSVKLYATLRRSIILGEYPQGSPLYEQHLAEQLNVSRVPIREAMPLLANDGFIETSPHRSAVVTTWTRQSISDVFDARLGLEVVAAGAAARRVRAGGTLDELEAAVAEAQRQLQTLKPTDALRQAELNGAIHVALVAAAHNALITSLMRAVAGRIVWLFYLTSGRDLMVQGQEHEMILEAVRSGNDRLAEALTIAHIEEGRAPTLTALTSTSAWQH
ncbi:GntR family transcriptional regulator [Frankia sp. AgB32]|uniref:GntR family transcriptional regulator n=1 Tax=Frankia sp. AgB32 TaxID=631119 RepID=UPI00200D2658|nr:GntR family transcriptional regulator [Frankia sp. AgB32]MCK9897848.1 GntR family transcriptional regulator [Frankia sp. AgB32]